MLLKKILVVDDERNNLKLIRTILSKDYELMFSLSGQEAIEIAKAEKPALILLDVMMPDMDGYQVCKTLKECETTQSIPIIFITAMTTEISEEKGFEVGCVDYITKPISAAILKARVKTHLALVKMSIVEEINHSAILMLGEAGHFHDDCTGNHIWRMSEYAYNLALELKLEPDFCFNIKYAAAMHDTGKIGIGDGILTKPDKLNALEWEKMKQHPEIGYNILKKNKTPLFQMAAEVSRYHHEKWDGSGYPFGLKGEDIPISARIVAICDVFDALVSERPYKKPWKIESVIKEMTKLSGTHFDPNYLKVFLDMLPTILQIKAKFDE